jgi:hypothetical protein
MVFTVVLKKSETDGCLDLSAFSSSELFIPFLRTRFLFLRTFLGSLAVSRFFFRLSPGSAASVFSVSGSSSVVLGVVKSMDNVRGEVNRIGD